MLSAQTENAFEIYGEGVRAFYAQDFPTALAKYNEALLLKPNTVGYLYNRGLTLLKLNNLKPAKEDFLKITTLDSSYLDAYYQLGKLQMDEKQFDSAFAYFRKALLISPNHVKSLEEMGLLFYYKRKNKEAIDIYTKVIELEPEDEQAYYKRGLVKINTADFEGAIKDFSKTYELNPKNTLALEQRANAYQKANNLENACKDWHELLLKSNPRAKENIYQYCVK